MKENRPWYKRDSETVKAYAAFTVYLELGARRSFGKCAAALGRPKGYVGQLEKWSRDHNWVDRVGAFDSFELETAIGARDVARERFRQQLIEELGGLAVDLIAIARGRCTCKPGKTGHKRTCALRATGPRVKALSLAIEQAGASPPRRHSLEHTGPGGKAIEVSVDQASRLVQSMTDEELERVRLALSEDEGPPIELSH